MDKKAKRKKRLENEGKPLEESGSEIEEQKESDGEDGKKKEKVVEHKPLTKTTEDIKKS